ncbi:MAG: helix-turn-helix domain-containing protein [Streptosporangiales bacterium]|nr:helix-turn-helix domain-containing protein [Streptosporangiales bacterium]
MAGFSDRGMTPFPLRLIPHPAVTLLLAFGTGSPAVDDATGREQHGSLVGGLGLGFGAARLQRAENITCLQVRLPPVVAGAVLGVRPSDLDGAVVSLDDLWGRETVRVDRLATELGWSRKRLWSRFHAQIGLPPKRTAKLVRFDHAAHRLVAGRDAARVAADGGYTDQSHLHRDVMAFAGVTPATVAAEPFLTIDDIAWPTRPSRPWAGSAGGT